MRSEAKRALSWLLNMEDYTSERFEEDRLTTDGAHEVGFMHSNVMTGFVAICARLDRIIELLEADR